MPLKLSDHATELGTYHVVAAFDDEDGAGIAPATLTWTLTDRDGNIVNSRSAVNVAGPSTSNTITLQGTDLALLGGQTNDRIFTIEWTYDSTYGAGLPGKEQATFIIDPLKAVS